VEREGKAKMSRNITRRNFLKHSVIGTIGTAAASMPMASLYARAKDRSRRPNIVMYISDDHGIDFLGCYGNADIQTPNIDALAREGMLFNNMFAASPTCAPSRSVLWTGLHSARNGCMGNHTTCRTDITALPTYLRRLGYRVVLAHKFHAEPRKEVFNFEYIDAGLPRNPANQRVYRREGLNTKVVDKFLAEHAKNRSDTPLCLILGDSSPHVTWESNKTYEPAKLKLPTFIVDTKLTRKSMANYYQDITTMDKRVGEVGAMLEKYGFKDDTLFIYTTDQGSEWPHSKWTLYDSGIRVPFIAVWGGKIKHASVCDAMISFVDVTPTFIDIAGGEQPEGLDGKSFLDVMLGKTKAFREYIYASHTRDGDKNVFPQRCVRDSRYKYILNLKPENTWTTHFTLVPDIPESHKQVWDTWTEKAKTDNKAAKLLDIIQHHPAEELYDLHTDPYELNNIADKCDRKILNRLQRKLKTWMLSQNDPGLNRSQTDTVKS
jgi:N-sulfoglucosamine sulfohydrolase